MPTSGERLRATVLGRVGHVKQLETEVGDTCGRGNLKKGTRRIVVGTGSVVRFHRRTQRSYRET